VNASYSDTSGKKLHEGSFGASAKFPDQALSDFVASSQLAIKSYLLPPDNGGGGDPVSRLTVNHFRCLDADWDGWFGGEPEFYISVYYHGIYQRTDFFDVVEEQLTGTLIEIF